MLKYSNKKVIEVQDWDRLVVETYGKPYCFQQQWGCQASGTHDLQIPSDWSDDDEMHDSIPELVNGDEMGVKFAVWLDRDPKTPLVHKGKEEKEQWMIDMFWNRNFYPDIQIVANDLYEKGLIEAGDYTININW